MNRSWQFKMQIIVTDPDEQGHKKGIPLWAVLIAVGIVGIGLFTIGLLVGQAIPSVLEVAVGVGVELL